MVRKKRKQRKNENGLERNVARLLDANINRAKEGLRVVEDTARYLWNDQKLYSQTRRIRHRFQSLTENRYVTLLKSRNSRQDVGRSIVEFHRATVGKLVTANIRRSQEAARVLEEYGKVFMKKAASEFKKIRYQLYDLEKVLVRKMERRK